MDGKIVMLLGLVAIALTIAGSSADGDTTPAVLAAVDSRVAEADSNAVQNVERAGNFKCYEFKCGKKYYEPEERIKPCEAHFDPRRTEACESCQKITFNGKTGAKNVEYFEGGCHERDENEENGCKELSDAEKERKKFAGSAQICVCSKALCNSPLVSDESSENTNNKSDKSLSSVSSPIAFLTLAAVVIAVKMSVI